MTAPTSQKYAQMTWAEKIGLAFVLLRLPLVITYNLIVSPFSESRKNKTWRRVAGDAAFRSLVTSCSIPQLQKLLGEDIPVYTAWAKKKAQPVKIEELDQDARLMWLGPKRTDRVILYLHGGGYVVPMQDFALDFWRNIQQLSEKGGKPTGIAVLSYTLIPEGAFPTQLAQSAIALQYLLDAGVQPANIYLTGDSAGGNLVLQLVSHILHPLAGVPLVTLSTPLAGAYLMSPWVSLTGDTGSHEENSPHDVFDGCTVGGWGERYLEDVPPAAQPYVELLKTPPMWFDSLSSVLRRVFITAGSKECLRDDIVAFSEILREKHTDVVVEVQQGGIHNDPHYDFMSMQGSKVGDLTHRIAAWFLQ